MDPKVVPCPQCHAAVGADCTDVRPPVSPPVTSAGVRFQHWERFRAARAHLDAQYAGRSE